MWDYLLLAGSGAATRTLGLLRVGTGLPDGAVDDAAYRRDLCRCEAQAIKKNDLIRKGLQVFDT
jgi:hypothetical protein